MSEWKPMIGALIFFGGCAYLSITSMQCDAREEQQQKERTKALDAICYPLARTSGFTQDGKEFVVCATNDGGMEIKPVLK